MNKMADLLLLIDRLTAIAYETPDIQIYVTLPYYFSSYMISQISRWGNASGILKSDHGLKVIVSITPMVNIVCQHECDTVKDLDTGRTEFINNRGEIVLRPKEHKMKKAYNGQHLLKSVGYHKINGHG